MRQVAAEPLAMGPLWAYAAPREGEPWADDPGALRLGVGKVAAALSLLRRGLERPPAAVVLFGLAGAYPGGPAVGEACLVTDDWLADEGVDAPAGFVPLEALGLGRRGPWSTDDALTDRLDRALGGGLSRVRAATVSTCSGTDALAHARVLGCPGVAVETMEGAAVGAACAELGVPWAQLRVISNRTGDRDRAGWDLEGSLAALHRAVRRARAALDRA
ncbi:MAG: futalosine hydrolase [Myxococcales bacterium]|nr:futalosine hydrolase [Myxococcales bacterium]